MPPTSTPPYITSVGVLALSYSISTCEKRNTPILITYISTFDNHVIHVFSYILHSNRISVNNIKFNIHYPATAGYIGCL